MQHDNETRGHVAQRAALSSSRWQQGLRTRRVKKGARKAASEQAGRDQSFHCTPRPRTYPLNLHPPFQPCTHHPNIAPIASTLHPPYQPCTHHPTICSPTRTSVASASSGTFSGSWGLAAPLTLCCEQTNGRSQLSCLPLVASPLQVPSVPCMSPAIPHMSPSVPCKHNSLTTTSAPPHGNASPACTCM